MYYFTKEGLEQLKLEYEQFKSDFYEKVKENNEDIELNLNESGSFLNTRNELYNLSQYKKRDFYEKIDNAIIIEETEEYKNWDKETVIRKCSVVLSFDGEEETYKILGYGETGDNIMYCDADLAKALLGKKVNDSVDFRGSKVVIKKISPVKNLAVKKLELKR